MVQLRLSLGIAATTRMSRFTRVAANEQMLLKLGHTSNLQDFCLDELEGLRLRDTVVPAYEAVFMRILSTNGTRVGDPWDKQARAHEPAP